MVPVVSLGCRTLRGQAALAPAHTLGTPRAREGAVTGDGSGLDHGLRIVSRRFIAAIPLFRQPTLAPSADLLDEAGASTATGRATAERQHFEPVPTEVADFRRTVAVFYVRAGNRPDRSRKAAKAKAAKSTRPALSHAMRIHRIASRAVRVGDVLLPCNTARGPKS